MSSALLKIKRLILRGQYAFTEKAVIEIDCDHLTEEEVIAYCKDNLASYKKPKLVRFVDALPRTASMKVQKNILRQQFAHLKDSQQSDQK